MVHIFSVKAPETGCSGHSIEKDSIVDLSEGNLTAYMQKDYLHLLNGKLIQFKGPPIKEESKDLA